MTKSSLATPGEDAILPAIPDNDLRYTVAIEIGDDRFAHTCRAGERPETADHSFAKNVFTGPLMRSVMIERDQLAAEDVRGWIAAVESHQPR